MGSHLFASEEAADDTRRVRLSAKIICGERSSIFDCVVRAVSATSATLEMPSTLGVPRSFHLRIKPSDAEHECELAWRTEREIGVTFGFKHNIIGEARDALAKHRLAMPRRSLSSRPARSTR